MRINSFEVRSYRSCIKTSFPLNPTLTGLIGINSAGKSNILNAILLLRKICRPRYVPPHEGDTSFNKCSISANLQYDKKSLQMKGEIIFETDERNYDEIQRTNLKWNLLEFTGESQWVSIPIELIAFPDSFHAYPRSLHHRALTRTSYQEFRKVLQKNQHLLSEVVSFFSGINYYSASQFSDPSRCPVSIELEEQRPLRRARTFAGHEQFMLDLYRTWKAHGKPYKRYLSTINKEGIGLVDDFEFTEVEMPSSSVEVRSGGKIRRIERTRLLIVPSFTVDGNKLSPNQLSEGTFKTLALLFYVLTDESKLLLIEEPEVCIHHGLLNSIISLIKTHSKQKQIVISTHSDFVLDQLSPDNLVLVKRQAQTGTVAKPLNKSMSKNDYKALRRYLEESGNLGEYWREGGFSDE
ncbi:MAG TPA: AAA family ATPase [Candidatus Nanoarchaeia archaeon]|nr:AAA family ATPase [Candidatus Nanoarchaeia archaeon]